MNIIVCVKRVPSTEAKIKIHPGGTDIDRTNLSYVVNPYDEFGVEEALRIKERFGGEIIAVTIGPAKAAEALRTCLAMGVDKAVHVKDPACEGGDSFTTASVLSEALKRFPYDIIFFGKQAVDDDNAAVGIQVAELMGLPHVAVVNRLEIDPEKRRAVAHRQIEGGIEVVEVPLPALFTCQKGLNEPRYASLPGIMKAKQKPLQELTLSDLGIDPGTVGAAGARLRVVRMSPPPKRMGGEVITGEPQKAVAELVRRLREEAKVL